MNVRLRVSRELLEEFLALGDRRIVGAELQQTGYSFEPTANVVFTVDAADAPEGTVEMSPTLSRDERGRISMVDPGWISG